MGSTPTRRKSFFVGIFQSVPLVAAIGSRYKIGDFPSLALLSMWLKMSRLTAWSRALLGKLILAQFF